jgi:hypothetical protein
MKRTTLLLFAVFFLTTMGTLLGCGGAKKDAENSNAAAGAAATGDLAGAPSWVMGPCEKFFGERTVVCGVGSVQGMTNFSLARSAAQGRGRTEIAKKLEVRIRSVLTDYQSASSNTSAESGGTADTTTEGRGDSLSTTNNSMNSSSVSDQMIAETTRQITEMTLNGSSLAESWMSPNGSVFALMVLESADFASTVENMSTVSGPLKQVVLDNIPKLFSDYDD